MSENHEKQCPKCDANAQARMAQAVAMGMHSPVSVPTAQSEMAGAFRIRQSPTLLCLPGCTLEGHEFGCVAAAQQSAALRNSLTPCNDAANSRYGIAQMLRAPGKTFTRAEVLTSLRAILASKGGIAEAIVAFENLE